MTSEQTPPLPDWAQQLIEAERERPDEVHLPVASVLKKLEPDLRELGALGSKGALLKGAVLPVVAAAVLGAGGLMLVRQGSAKAENRDSVQQGFSKADLPPQEEVFRATLAPAGVPAEIPAAVKIREKTTPQPAAPEGDALKAELELLVRAKAAFAKRDDAEAMRALESHAQEFPEGALTEERSALTVRVLSALGRHTEAGAAAQSFVEHYPTSVYLQMVIEASNASQR